MGVSRPREIVKGRATAAWDGCGLVEFHLLAVEAKDCTCLV